MSSTTKSLGDGSHWLKSDVHVHTPASHDYGSKGESYQDIADAINESDLDVIAITDHWTFDGYEQLRPLIKPGKLLLPGIELKLEKNIRGKHSDKGGFHVQVIFPETSDLSELRAKFLYQLSLCEEDGRIPNRKDLIALGAKHAKDGSSEGEQWAIGCQQAYTPLKAMVKQAHLLGGLVIIPYDRHGGFEGIDPKTESELKSYIHRNTDIIETNDNSTRIGFYEHEGVLAAVGKKTPGFTSSDAHKAADIGAKFTWVKGELSFEGIRQTLYFPKERVSFDKQKPAYAHPRIKSLKLTETDGDHPLASLESLSIPFHDNLTTIIGHPSIGKSTLIEVIAYLFSTETEDEIGEEVSKIANLQDKNDEMVIEARVESGGSDNTLIRNLSGAYSGDITAEKCL